MELTPIQDSITAPVAKAEIVRDAALTANARLMRGIQRKEADDYTDSSQTKGWVSEALPGPCEDTP